MMADQDEELKQQQNDIDNQEQQNTNADEQPNHFAIFKIYKTAISVVFSILCNVIIICVEGLGLYRIYNMLLLARFNIPSIPLTFCIAIMAIIEYIFQFKPDVKYDNLLIVNTMTKIIMVCYMYIVAIAINMVITLL